MDEEFFFSVNFFSPIQDTVTNGPLTKHSHTEQVMMMHTLKTKLSKYQNFIDKAFEHIAQGSDEQIIEVCLFFFIFVKMNFDKMKEPIYLACCQWDQGKRAKLEDQGPSL